MSDIQAILGIKGTLTPRIYGIQGSLNTNLISIKGSLSDEKNSIESNLSQNNIPIQSTLNSKLELCGYLSQSSECLSGNISGTENLKVYDKNYNIVPIPYNNITLGTKGLMMVDNVIVEKIPYEEVSNQTGGLTVTIGGY